METKANYAIVGFFTIMVIAAAFGFVYWMAQYGRGGPMTDLVIRIPGSANGLSVGSPVRFNGIAVGTVRGLAIDAKDPEFSVAFTEVKEDAPILKSTKAVLEIQGLTGAAYVELTGGKAGEENILAAARAKGETPVLLADQSSVTNLLATADKIMGKADDAIGDIQGFVSDSRVPLTNTVRNAEQFTKSLSDNSEGIDKFLESVSALSDTVTQISGRLDSTISGVDNLVKAIDPKKIASVIDNAEKISSDIAGSTGEINETVKSFRQTAATFDRFGNEAEKAVKQIETLLAAVDTVKIGSSINDVSAATADARAAIASIRGVTDNISARQKEIDETISNVTSMTDKLNKASGRVDGILVKVDGVVAKVDTLLGSGDANSLFAEARKTLESFRSVAENINARIGPIADSLARFSSTGLRDVQNLVGETRRTIENLDDTITNFDRDPQRLLFGGDNVKTFNGRTRH